MIAEGHAEGWISYHVDSHAESWRSYHAFSGHPLVSGSRDEIQIFLQNQDIQMLMQKEHCLKFQKFRLIWTWWSPRTRALRHLRGITLLQGFVVSVARTIQDQFGRFLLTVKLNCYLQVQIPEYLQYEAPGKSANGRPRNFDGYPFLYWTFSSLCANTYVHFHVHILLLCSCSCSRPYS